ncbi:ABC transporter ATP-binding protein [Bacillus sp. HMF5848]|uniref:ABC transporter ATP-binding protein n=1 Tax=Bacillus sp. HMF5848 TaxID=2495421 RepID=UPI000F7971EC|nr:ABC transporter ATP-binding protein [Bacillus sp. HMF5848]RSK29066.1 ABC transporter ATP-binding protein [Bacillus sp. HMF5848]
MAFIKISNLTKTLSNQTIFTNLNMSVSQGDIISLVGPSGCGKTTFLRSIAGLEQVTGGQLLLEGQDITYTKTEKRPIVLMFQQPLLFPHMTILQNITFGLKYQKHRLPKRERLASGLRMLEKIGLSDYGSRYPHQLSGGQQQRVALARALVMNPALLLLDEPFSSLDPNLRSALRTWVRDFLKKEGVTAIFVTHDREEAMSIGDQVVVMKDGMFQQIGAPNTVYQQPVNREVAALFSEGLIIEKGFIAANKISLSQKGLNKNASSHIHGACVEEKFLKYGQMFYKVHLKEIDQRVVIMSQDEFTEGSKVFVIYDSKDIQLFNHTSPTNKVEMK